ncbi:YlzJ-like family protein [Bacillus rubiinfantis]|uniref:YlzJ-like family protein n=1 Tax=Bacillus rubiinfantis TaxID=1499680 RepID=UPI0005AA4552|nr:YlzJ-like family protein [Bacillus rubiinfantis]
MIWYTMMPHELMFPTEMNQYESQQRVIFQGIPLLVEKTDSQYVQVIQVLSSDPQHFLDMRVCPGSKISYASLDGAIS